MTYRVYFNNTVDWPQIWSIDQGDVSTEVNVIGFRSGECRIAGGSASDFTAIDSTREPKVWVNVEASRLVVEGGIAVFEP